MTVLLYKTDFAEDKFYIWESLVNEAFNNADVSPEDIDEVEVDVVATYSAKADPESPEYEG